MKAINMMRQKWVQGYQRQKGQYDFAEQEIRGEAESRSGATMAGMAASGLLGTTAGTNMLRGDAQRQQRGLIELGSRKAGSEYGMWMDRAKLFGMTEFDNMQFNPGDNSQMLGALAGQAMGQQGLPDWMTTMPSWLGGGGGGEEENIGVDMPVPKGSPNSNLDLPGS